MKMTQGAQLAREIMNRPKTTMELLSLCISTCPWKRLREFEMLHKDEYRLDIGKRYIGGSKYLTTWRVVRREPA